MANDEGGSADGMSLGWLDSADQDDDWLGLGEAMDLEGDELKERFALEAALRHLTNKIHSSSLDEILLSVGDDIRELVSAERVTLYVLDKLKREIYSKVKDGDETKEIRVKVGPQSLAGYVAATGRSLRIADAYDDAELKAIDTVLNFDISWDQKTGFRTKQILAVPIKAGRKVEGVIQLVNHRDDRPFTDRHQETLQEVSETLSIAFANQKQIRSRRSRYDHLYALELINEELVDQANELSRKEGGSAEFYLMENFKVPKKEILASLSEYYRTAPIEYQPEAEPPQEVLEQFTVDYLKHHGVCPVGFEGQRLVIAMTNPKDVVLCDDLRQRVDRALALRVAIREDVLCFVDLFYPEPSEDEATPQIADLTSLIDDMDFETPVVETKQEEEEVKENSSGLMKLVNQIIAHAYKRGVSDIHIEPYPESDVVVRYRIDGVCQVYTTVPRRFARAMLSRLKIMSGLDIAERRLPQDGKIKFKKYSNLDIELRVATLPTVGGLEDCVMRILAASEPMPLDNMGFSPENLTGFKYAVSQPYGLVLVVGPTGSGKTTTLHSALGFINKPETKIWTAEDPVEITQRGLRQVQMLPKIGLNFERAMRAFLRADPDVIMIGEMRDRETAEAGVEASLTGHLVFSTLHTNSAPETVTRLLDMGLDPYSFGDSLLGVLAQRLMRRACKACRKEVEVTPEMLTAFQQEFDNDTAWERLQLGEEPLLHEPVGCGTCGERGYKGRMGIHEFMPGSDDIRSVIYRHGKVAEIREQALSEGMTTLKQDGIRKVLQGFTDIKEVRRVCIK